jgi:outer membrane protein assembly factor BamB
MPRTIIPLLSLLVLTSGAEAQDWPQFQHDAQRQGRLTVGPTGPYRARWIWCGPQTVLRNNESHVGWQDDLKGRDGYSYPLPGSVPMTFAEGMQPVHAAGVLYALDQEGLAYAINSEDGSTRWIGNNPGGSVNSPVVADNVLVCPSVAGRLTALRLSDGQTAWTVETGRAITGSPALVNGTIYVANHGGYVFALDATSGKLHWKVRLSGPCVGGIAADEQGCYLGAEDKHFYALRAEDGSLRAKAQLTGQGFRQLWPVLFQDKVIVQVVGTVCIGACI